MITDEDRKRFAMKIAFMARRKQKESELEILDYEAYKTINKDKPIKYFYREKEDAEIEIKELDRRYL